VGWGGWASLFPPCPLTDASVTRARSEMGSRASPPVFVSMTTTEVGGPDREEGGAWEPEGDPGGPATKAWQVANAEETWTEGCGGGGGGEGAKRPRAIRVDTWGHTRGRGTP
jgi:hypothetical protein